MSRPQISRSGLVRVTVASGTRRVDLVLPGAIPVVELVPELARSVGLLDAATVYGGYSLVTSEGRRLVHDSGLTMQGIEDGAVVTVSAGVDEPVPTVYDDVVEAMTDVVEHDLRPWEPSSGRTTALAAAVLMLALGAATLLVQGSSAVAASAAAVVALILVVGAVVLSRAQLESEAAVTVAWTGAGYATAAGYLAAGSTFGPPDEAFGLPLAAAGAGAALVGLVCLVGLGPGRTLLLPAAVVGAVLAVAGVLVHGTSVDVEVLLTVVTSCVVLAGSVFPWLALGLTSTTVDQLYTPADITADPDDIDPSRLSTDARLAHEILVAISATVGLMLVLTAPLAVSLGLAGTLLSCVMCLVVMVRTRQYRTGSEVLVGLVSGILGLVSVAVSILVGWSEWRPALAVVLAVVGAVVLTTTLLSTAPSVRRGRFGDVLETVALVSLLPLLVVASGLFDVITT